MCPKKDISKASNSKHFKLSLKVQAFQKKTVVIYICVNYRRTNQGKLKSCYTFRLQIRKKHFNVISLCSLACKILYVQSFLWIQVNGDHLTAMSSVCKTHNKKKFLFLVHHCVDIFLNHQRWSVKNDLHNIFLFIYRYCFHSCD